MDRALALALLALAALFVGDQLAWTRLDGQPLAREDSPLHALAAMRAAETHRHHGAPLGAHVFWQAGYYPPFTYWLAIWPQSWLGLEATRYRDTLALFTGALVLGVGGLAWRLWGRAAALAAAGLALCSPLLYTQRPESMLDAPLAGMLALALAACPRGAARPLAALGGGVLAGLVVLTKQAGLFFVVPLALALAVGVLRAAPGARGPAARAALAWAGGAALTCGPWLWRSARFFVDVLQNVREQHALPEGLAGLWWRLSWLVYLKQGVLAPPLLPLLAAGVGVALWRRPPGLGALALAALGGFVGLSGFPDAHERHWAPFAPLLLVLAVAPLGATRAWPRVRATLGATLALAGVLATLSWRWPEQGEGWRVDLYRDAALRRTLPTPSLSVLTTELLYRPPRPALLAPLPRGWVWPTRALVAEVLAQSGVCNDPRPDRGPVLITQEARVSADLLHTDASALGCHALRARHVEPQQLDRWLVDHSRDLGAGVWAVTVQNGEERHPAALEAAGFSPVQRYSALESGSVETSLVLWRK